MFKKLRCVVLSHGYCRIPLPSGPPIPGGIQELPNLNTS